MLQITAAQAFRFRRLNRRLCTNPAYFIQQHRRILREFRRQHRRRRHLTHRTRAQRRMRTPRSGKSGCGSLRRSAVRVVIQHNRYLCRGIGQQLLTTSCAVEKAPIIATDADQVPLTAKQRREEVAKRGCRIAFRKRPDVWRYLIIKRNRGARGEANRRRLIVGETPRGKKQRKRSNKRIIASKGKTNGTNTLKLINNAAKDQPTRSDLENGGSSTENQCDVEAIAQPVEHTISVPGCTRTDLENGDSSYITQCIVEASMKVSESQLTTQMTSKTLDLNCSDVSDEDDLDAYLDQNSTGPVSTDSIALTDRLLIEKIAGTKPPMSNIDSDEDFSDLLEAETECESNPFNDSQLMITSVVSGSAANELAGEDEKPPKSTDLQYDELSEDDDVTSDDTSQAENPVKIESHKSSAVKTENKVPPESLDNFASNELNVQIREQLAFFKMGKRKEPFLAESIGCVRSTSKSTDAEGTGTPLLWSRNVSQQSLPDNLGSNATPATTPRKTRVSDTECSAEDTRAEPRPPQQEFRRNFIDTLINKLKTERSVPGASITTISNKLIQPMSLQRTRKTAETADLASDQSSDTTDFHGFNEITFPTTSATNRLPPAVPGMLPTPIVPSELSASNAQSAFVSEALDTFMKENRLENSARIELPAVQPRHNAALVTHDSPAPQLAQPTRPLHLERPRTLAEKRIQMARETDLRVRMLDNESYVYRALKRRTRHEPTAIGGPVAGNSNVNTCIAEMQNHRVPFSRDCWRATSWLATRCGRFYYQTVRTSDGNELAVCGSRGDHRQRIAWQQPTIAAEQQRHAEQHSAADAAVEHRRCRGRCRPFPLHLRINNLDEFISQLYPKCTPNSSSSLSSSNNCEIAGGSAAQLPSSTSSHNLRSATADTDVEFRANCRPCPLSKKRLPARASPDLDLGPLQIYQMPSVHLEVWPRLDTALPEQIRPYLKLVAPFEAMTPQWVQFALATLQPPRRPEYTTTKRGRVVPRSSYTEAAEEEGGGGGGAINHSKRAVGGDSTGAEQSFTFDIPYANGQRRLLVRRRRKLESICSQSSDLNGAGAAGDRQPIGFDDDVALTFDANVDADDAAARAVADVLRGMMNSVAVACMEAYGVSDDPDVNYEPPPSAAEDAITTAKGPSAVESFRKEKSSWGGIRRELKRLNATIIDNYETPAKENCTEIFCKQGCICDSLSVRKNHPLHCRKIACMFECSCPQKTISAMENRNSSIEQIRHRANARLAKEEREFRATIVLSEDRTIYIPNRENVGKRNKRVPKRYHDNAETPFGEDADLAGPSAIPANKRVAARGSLADATASTSNNAPVAITATAPKSAKTETQNRHAQIVQRELSRMRHCAVQLTRLPDSLVAPLEPWCMVHHLYKCFCKLRATTGKPFTFAEQAIITEYPDVKSVAERGSTAAAPADADDNYTVPTKKRQYTFEKVEPKLVSAATAAAAMPAAARQPTTEHHRLEHCARTRRVLATRRSREAISRDHAQFREHERQHTDLLRLLNNRIRHCLLWGDGKLSPVESQQSTAHATSSAGRSEATSTPSLQKPANKTSLKRKLSTATATSTSLPPQLMSQKVPRPAVAQCVTTAAASEPLSPETAERLRLRHTHNLKYFNYCVNRTMEQIKTAQKNTQHVKNPIVNSLNCMQWNRFCELFARGEIYVWQIRLDNPRETILGLTVLNIMPLIAGALCVVNIRAVTILALPLLAQMLVRGERGPKTAQMAVLLCGKSNYWKIISMMNSERNYLELNKIIKPSLRTHPQLAAKISHLFSQLTSKRHLSAAGEVEANAAAAASSDDRDVRATFVSATTERTTAARLPTSISNSLSSVPPTSLLTPRTAASLSMQPPPAVVQPPTSVAKKQRKQQPQQQPQQHQQQPQQQQQQQPQSIPTTSPTTTPIYASRQSYAALIASNEYRQTCNIQIVGAEVHRVNAMFLPIPEVGERRWLMLLLAADFSHILIPTWKTFLSVDKIRTALALAGKTEKTVRISSSGCPPDVYASPSHTDRIFFGPYDVDAELDLALYRQYEGKLCLVEDWERMTGQSAVPESSQRTNGCWLYRACSTRPSETPTTMDTQPQPQPQPIRAVRDAEVSGRDAAEATKRMKTARTDGDGECNDSDDCMIVETPVTQINLADDEDDQSESVATAMPKSEAKETASMIARSEPAMVRDACKITEADQHLSNNTVKPMISLSPPANLTYISPVVKIGQQQQQQQLQQIQQRRTLPPTEQAKRRQSILLPRRNVATTSTLQLPSAIDSTQSSPGQSRPENHLESGGVKSLKSLLNAKHTQPPPMRPGVLPTSRLTTNTSATNIQYNYPSIVSVYSGASSTTLTGGSSMPQPQHAAKSIGGALQISSSNLKDLVAAKIQSKLPSSLVITTCPARPAQPPRPSCLATTTSAPLSVTSAPVAHPVAAVTAATSVDIITLVSEDEDDGGPADNDVVRSSASIRPERATTATMIAGGQTSDLGFLVCSLGSTLGRIEAKRNAAGLSIRFCGTDAWTAPQKSGSAANQLIHQHIREHVFAFEPRSLQLQWRFVPVAKLTAHLADYPLQSADVLSATSVVTDVGRVDLSTDFETGSSFSRELLLRLLALKLAYLCRMDKVELRTRSFQEILQRAEKYIRWLGKRETKYERLKMSWAVKLHHNQTKLRDLQKQLALDQLQQNKRDRTSVTKVVLDGAWSKVQSNAAVPENKPPLMPPPPLVKSQSPTAVLHDVIEIDDDDDGDAN